MEMFGLHISINYWKEIVLTGSLLCVFQGLLLSGRWGSKPDYEYKGSISKNSTGMETLGHHEFRQRELCLL